MLFSSGSSLSARSQLNADGADCVAWSGGGSKREVVELRTLGSDVRSTSEFALPAQNVVPPRRYVETCTLVAAIALPTGFTH